MDGIPARAMDLFKAKKIGRWVHSGRSLLDHVLSVYRLLVSWGNPRHICLAGLFHSAYGTQDYVGAMFRLDSRADRERLRTIIGAKAEALAFLFCIKGQKGFLAGLAAGRVIHRLDHSIHEVDAKTGRALAEIYVANLVDQFGKPRSNFISRERDLARLIKTTADCRPYISVAAQTYCEAFRRDHFADIDLAATEMD